MGRRSRKRGHEIPAAPVPAVAARPQRGERPRAPWHPFPLVELCVLIGLVLLVWGLVRGGEDGAVLLVAGMALASLAGLETALREHFSGHASHALLLAALPAVLTAGALYVAGAPRWAVPLGLIGVGLAGYVALRRSFRARS